MENYKRVLTNNEMSRYKKIIANRFIDNPRMSLLFNKEQKQFKNRVFNLVNYCFNIALSVGWVYAAKNRKTVVLFYERKKLKKTFMDYCRYMKVIRGILIYNLFRVLKNERDIKKSRIKLNNYLYVWFIAQESGYVKLDGLVEINKILFGLSHQKKLPILFETSDSRLVNFYEHVGYEVYNTLKNGDSTVYFFIGNRAFIEEG